MTLVGNAISLLWVDQRCDQPAFVGEANGIDATNFDPFEENGHPLLDGQITRHDIDALAARRFCQPLVEDEGLPFLRLGRRFGGVKGDTAAQNGSEAASLNADTRQTERALDATDIPEAGIGFDQMFKTRLDHQIQNDVLVVLTQTGIDDAAHFDAAEVELGTDTDRAQRIGGEVQHPPLRLIAGGRAVEGIKLLLQRIALAPRLQIDVVAGDKGIETGNLGQRCLGAHQPEVGSLANKRAGTAVNLGQHRNATTILGQLQLLHHPDGNPLITDLGLARQDAVTLSEVDLDKLAAARYLLIEKAASQQQGDEW